MISNFVSDDSQINTNFEVRGVDWGATLGGRDALLTATDDMKTLPAGYYVLTL
jgi:hypothetical protein